MDAYDATKVVYSRVQAMEPDHASKIMGYLLLQDEGEQEMFRLAFSHDSILQAVVLKAKTELGLLLTSSSASSQSSYGNPNSSINNSSLLSSSSPASPHNFISSSMNHLASNLHSKVGSLVIPPPASPLSSSTSIDQFSGTFLQGHDHDASYSDNFSVRAASDHHSLASQIRLNRMAEQLQMDRYKIVY